MAIKSKKKKSSRGSRERSRNLRLPSKPSDLILVALDDLKVAAQDGCEIDMSVWHTPSTYENLEINEFGILVEKDCKVCAVCLAGAVMRRAVVDKDYAAPEDFPDSVTFKLLALDQFRTGDLRQGMEELGFDWEIFKGLGFEEVVYIPEYGENPKGFLKAMTSLANKFAKVGY